jgi:hypothetical protein
LAITYQYLKRSLFHLTFVIFTVLSWPSLSYAPSTASIEQQVAAVQSTPDKALERVKVIVNQPVDHVRRTPDMSVSVFSPGWFHEGAIKPDFATVDIRATQDLQYSKSTYVTSNLNPGEVFIGNQLEFNSMTKYFYIDRTLPKRRLEESEMLEINQLYRTIARSTQRLEQLKESEGLPFVHISEFFAGIILVAAALTVGGLYFLWPAVRRR